VLLELHLREPGAGHAEAALIASDRARARNLRELLAESPDAIREGVPEALLQREQQTRQQVQAREADRMRVAAQKSAAVAEIDRADRAVATALAEYREVLGELRRVSPRYAALTQSAAISLDDIRAVIGDDTVVLSYWLGRSRSAAFVISRDAVKVAILPVSRSEVETAARRLHEAISKGPSVLLRTEQERAQAAVSAMILRPVSAWLTRERVVVVPDGALHYVPFATLSSTDADEPLIVHKEIVQAPSLAAMVALDREAVPTDGAGMRIAVLADPVLASSDPRVVSRGRITPSHAASTPDLIRSANAVGWSSFARLPYTRDEASSIGKLATHGRASLALDFEASRRTALDRKLNEFDVVHFATHGIINSSRPELSGIVLSLVNPQGQAEDGFLRLHDIYNMKLNAGLVVLSACRTALGADIRGEGLVGLTRGFMYAGAPRVVASLWDVRDRSTAELMTRFYRFMLHDGLAPAAALRQAQRSMWREPRWRHPANWGAFLLQGSWK
jgi:CHAT domain-containing protein